MLPEGVEAELLGRPAEAVGGPPKKSNPSSESEALVCFGGGAFLGGGGREAGASVVLGLTGGCGMSPNKSTCVAGFGGGTGWLLVEAEALWEEPRSNLAFS